MSRFSDADFLASLQMSMRPKEKDMPDCKHEDCQFLGWASMIGNYYCKNCGKKFTPEEYNQLQGSK